MKHEANFPLKHGHYDYKQNANSELAQAKESMEVFCIYQKTMGPTRTSFQTQQATIPPVTFYVDFILAIRVTGAKI